MKQLTYGSVCSGVEAASLAWEPLGWRPAWFAEIEPFPAAVLAHRWPEVPNYGDMTALEARILAGAIEAPDILVGGTPCQAFSVAGLRRSLQDERGNLTLVLVRLLNAINHVRAASGKPPCILVWENVPGVLNTRDNAFGCFLGAVSGNDEALQPAGERWGNAGAVLARRRETAWRVLDAKYFGVPQRRRRVFVVSGFGNIAPAEILFERKSLRGDTGAGEAAGQNPACYPESSFGAYREDVVAGTVKASGGACQGGSETLVCVNGNIIGKRPDGTSGGNGLGAISDGTAYTCIASAVHAVSDGLAVRRLTPLECERLQGFPDNHTRIPWRGKPAESCPDGQRYKAIGNSMAVPVMRWIGERIKKYIENQEV